MESCGASPPPSPQEGAHKGYNIGPKKAMHRDVASCFSPCSLQELSKAGVGSLAGDTVLGSVWVPWKRVQHRI